MKISARNIIKGKIKSMKSGAVNNEIIIELPGDGRSSPLLPKIQQKDLGWLPAKTSTPS